MAGTVTNSADWRPSGTISTFTMSWTSDASGNATADTPYLTGTILRVVTNPGATAPDGNYDVTLSDADGIDVLAGQGADRDATDSESICPGQTISDGTNTSVVPMVVAGILSLSVSNAGNAKQGSITIYLR